MSNQFKDVFVLSEWHLYGSSRLGIQKPNALNSYAQLTSATAGTGRELVHIEFEGSWSEYEVNYADTHYTAVTTYQMSYEYYSLTRGEKNYELTNHAGNVLVVISDKKLKTCTGDTVNYYTADIIQATDYSAFGASLSSRTYYANASNKYRNGFIGKENDDDIAGAGNSIDFGERMYDSRLGRFKSIDAYCRKYPFFSPYQYAGNSPIRIIDHNGDSLKLWGTITEYTKFKAIFEKAFDGQIKVIVNKKGMVALKGDPSKLSERDKILYDALNTVLKDPIVTDLYLAKQNERSKITVGAWRKVELPSGEKVNAVDLDDITMFAGKSSISPEGIVMHEIWETFLDQTQKIPYEDIDGKTGAHQQAVDLVDKIDGTKTSYSMEFTDKKNNGHLDFYYNNREGKSGHTKAVVNNGNVTGVVEEIKP